MHRMNNNDAEKENKEETAPKQETAFIKIILFMLVVAAVSIYGIYLSQTIINENLADEILNDVLEHARYEKNRIDSANLPPEEEGKKIERDYKMISKTYAFFVKEGSTSSLVKIETAKKVISLGVCKALRKKMREKLWRGLFEKVQIIDRMGNEKTDILVYDCPHEKIPSLRFSVIFESAEPIEEEIQEETLEENASTSETTSASEKSLPSSTGQTASYSRPSPAPAYKPNIKTQTYTSRTCPLGTSANGKGQFATNGCRCNNAREFWNGSRCEKSCPEGSSQNPSVTTDETNVYGCYCNKETPVWNGNRCISECQNNSDCFSQQKCLNYRCVLAENDIDDCRWGICQACDGTEKRSNVPSNQNCETAGLPGMCNGNGTCYPIKGRSCSKEKRCPEGYFCNYGGTQDTSKKQNGRFGKTPDVCQVVSPEEFTYKGVTYYYNNRKDLKSWCRAANNKPNCLWGYLAKSGAESWCASLGKRLLTRSEMAKVWNILKKELPQTYTGYAYWVQEGSWIEDKNGKRSFGKGVFDGYGGKGGVVCR